MLADLRYALRQFGKVPGFTLTAVLTLALGIGANTAIYSIIHGALRLPYPHSDRMIGVQNVYPQASYYAASYPDFIEWRAKATSFSQLVAVTPGRATWNGESFGKAEPEAVGAWLASEGYFKMYGLHPVLGRDFLASEHQVGSAPACLLTESFWREELHADSGVIGKALDLDGKSCTIVGVMPVMKPSASRPVSVWLPLETNKPWDQHGTNYLFVSGMLRPGVSPAQAQAELSTIQQQIDKQFPDNKHGIGVHPLLQAYFGDLRALMKVLLAAVGFILLIACVNLANMLLARTADRSHEFAVRRALGASPGRLLRQTLCESLLLSLGGAAAGLAVAFGLTHIPIAAWPKGVVPPSDVHPDAAILVFTCGLGILTGVLFGMMPAFRTLRQEDKQALQPGRTVTESRSHGRTRSILVIAEIALSMLLVVGALSVAMRFVALLHVDPGVNPHNAMVMTVMLPAKQYPKGDDQLRFWHALAAKLSSLPGVEAVGASVDTPFTGSNANGDFTYEGQPAGSADKNPFAEKHVITPGYLKAIGAELWQGRDFSSHDNAGSPQVVIINRTMAQKLWPGQSAIGKRIKAYSDWETVVGVVADIQFAPPGEPPAFQIYAPLDQSPQPSLGLALRTAPGFGADPLSLSEPARAAVASIDPRLAVSNMASLEVLSQEALAGQLTATTVTSILGVLALLLASIGVYGVMAYSVSRREREFGIRIALGASRARILRLLYSSVFRWVLSGMLLGMVLAWFGQVWIRSMLEIKETSPLVMALGGLLLCVIAAAAAAAPARRAMSVAPVKALRDE
ncbi:MAG TPA: ABC transporter permease [Terracidiphilus sp.]|nr:ABC transporter permease [Terracidiphilus sp.]